MGLFVRIITNIGDKSQSEKTNTLEQAEEKRTLPFRCLFEMNEGLEF